MQINVFGCNNYNSGLQINLIGQVDGATVKLNQPDNYSGGLATRTWIQEHSPFKGPNKAKISKLPKKSQNRSESRTNN